MFAARREHVVQVIRPALARGDWVRLRSLHRRHLCVPGRRPRRVARADRHARADRAPDCNPDLTLLFDVPGAVSRERLDRMSARGRALDKFEREAAGILRARAQRVSRASEGGSAALSRHRRDRPLAEVRADLAAHRRRAMTGDPDDDATRDAPPSRPSVAPLDWQRAALARSRRASRALAARAAAQRSARHRQARCCADALARALLCETPRDGGMRLRRVSGLPLRRRRPASRPARRRADRRDRRRRRNRSNGSPSIASAR